MGLFDRLFGRKPADPKGQYVGAYKMINGYVPVFSRFTGSIYESDLVRAAINAIAVNCGKLQVTIQGSAKATLQTKLKRAPNEVQTWSQFLARLATILYVHNTAFIVLTFDIYGDMTGVYSLLPDRCEVVGYKQGKEVVPYLRYKFRWGETAAIELDKVGIMTRFQYRDDLFGEGNAAMIPTMDLISLQNQGIKEGVKSAASYRFMARMNNFVKPEDMKKERLRFTEANFGRDADGTGVLLFPNNYTDIKQIESKPFVVDADQEKLIRENVYNYFGVSEKVMQGSANSDELDAFFNSSVEPFAIALSEAMSRAIYTERERSFGNHVYVNSNRLQYMTQTAKVSLARELGDRGILTINEIRELFNYGPIDGGDIAYIRGEYKPVETLDQKMEAPAPAEEETEDGREDPAENQ